MKFWLVFRDIYYALLAQIPSAKTEILTIMLIMIQKLCYILRHYFKNIDINVCKGIGLSSINSIGIEALA